MNLFDKVQNDSVPTITQFDPTLIPYQHRVIKDIRKNFDYSKGVYELLLSGSVGSAKSLLMCHIAITHCIMYPRANVLMGRKAMPQLKKTLYKMALDHVGNDLVIKDNSVTGTIKFPNGSEMFCFSWSDKKYRKARSYALSLAVIEELTENSDLEFYKEIRMRLDRVTHIPEKLIICATNPDSPSHPAYDYFIGSDNPLRKVYYSVTSDNPFLPESYIRELKETLSPREARRMLYGEWLELSTEIIYHNYDPDRNYINAPYLWNFRYPIDVFFDFNIGEGKPMSCAIGQHIDGVFHAAKDFVVNGARTNDILEEIDGCGVLQKAYKVRVFGDAAGRHNDTRSKLTDYKIIDFFMQNHKRSFEYERCVPLANPPIRSRHNIVNAQFLNDNGVIKFLVYKEAPTLHKGLKLTRLKKGADYIEHEDVWQHVTTAAGYWICRVIKELSYHNGKTINI